MDYGRIIEFIVDPATGQYIGTSWDTEAPCSMSMAVVDEKGQRPAE